MSRLRGVAWDHPRCTAPVDASIADFRTVRPDIEIVWERRSLHSFGEGDIREQTDRYDLIIYDHPFVGEVAQKALMADLTQYLSPNQISEFRSDSLGPSFASYEWDGGLYALPIDAAAQTSAYRPDLLDRVDREPPADFSELAELARRLDAAGLSIVTPLKQIDLFCLTMTLSANLGQPAARQYSEFLPSEVFAEVLERMRWLASISIPESRGINPIAAYEILSKSDEVAYSPFLFNYTNYARLEVTRPVLCADIPGVRTRSPRGACIGGAGIGVSARSRNIEAAVDYARFLCDPAYQSGNYVVNGGQPASLSAWRSALANDITCNFFRDCLATMQQSYLRPRFNGFMPFARAVGPLLEKYVDAELPASAVIEQTRLYWAKFTHQCETEMGCE